MTGPVTINGGANSFEINDIGSLTLTSSSLFLTSDVDKFFATGLGVTAGNFVTINTGDNSLHQRTVSETKTDLSLNNVENTALSTWAGSTNLTTLGTFSATGGTFTGTVTNYNSVATVNNGILSEVAVVNLTGQTAGIAATTAYTNGATDCYYLVCWNATVTTAATTSCVLGGFQLRYTNATDNVVKSFPTTNVNFVNQTNNNATTSAIGGSFTIKSKASTTIQYIMGYTSSGATPMAYDLNITVIKL